MSGRCAFAEHKVHLTHTDRPGSSGMIALTTEVSGSANDQQLRA